MRIGLDARYVYGDHVHGIGRYSLELLRHLAPLALGRHELVVFRRHDLPEDVLGDALPPTVRQVPVPFPPISIGSLVRMGALARRERLDLFHAHFPVLPLARPAPRVVVTGHDLQALRVPRFHAHRRAPVALAARAFYAFAYRRAFTGADRVVLGSTWARDDVHATYGVPLDRLRLVAEGLGRAFVEPVAAERVADVRARLGLAEPYVLNVGNFRPQKNVPALLAGFRAYLDLVPPATAPSAVHAPPRTLVLAGVQDRFFEEARAAAERLGLAPYVRFTGFVAEDDLPALYAGARLFVTASAHEGFGFTPLEALACGTPVAAARRGALPEVLGDAAQWFEPEFPAEVARAMLRALDASEEHAAAGRARARQYRWTETARRTLEVFEELAPPPSPDAAAGSTRA